MRTRPSSLKSRCYRSLAWLAAITWVVLSVALVIVAQRETDLLFDRALREHAHTTLSFSDHELAEIQALGGLALVDHVTDEPADPFVFQIWTDSGRLAYRSGHAPLLALTSGEPGFGSTALNGTKLRTYTGWNMDRSFQVQMAALPDLQANSVTWLSAAPSISVLAALSVFVLLVRRQLNHSLSPWETTVKALASRSPSNLSPVEMPVEAPELVPVVNSFNDLMSGVERSMRHEQRFSDDAAHALRTPLASLKILMENARRAKDDAARDEALQSMKVVVDQSSTLIDQLLHLARIDREPNAFEMAELVDLDAIAASVVATLSPLARERGISLQASRMNGKVRVRGNRETLSLALSSLVENAISFAPFKGLVLVELQCDADGADLLRLRVHDDGPGVSQHAQTRALSLLLTTSGSRSSNAGIGLALAERIVKIHGGSAHMGVSPLLGGAMAELRLPCAPA